MKTFVYIVTSVMALGGWTLIWLGLRISEPKDSLIIATIGFIEISFAFIVALEERFRND